MQTNSTHTPPRPHQPRRVGVGLGVTVGVLMLLSQGACDGLEVVDEELAEELSPDAELDPSSLTDEEMIAAQPEQRAQVEGHYELVYPSRFDRLIPGTFMTSGGGHGNTDTAYDTGAARFDSGEWVSWVANAKDPGSIGGATIMNRESTTYGVPIFAPEDGEVIGCWRNAPDRPGVGLGYDFDDDGVFDEGSPYPSGNFLLIRSDQGDHMLYFAHMMEGSVPSQLCPHATSEDWPSLAKAPSCSDPEYTQRPYAETVLPAPVPISAGDFLGRIGNSGQSSGPHMHFAVYPLLDDPEGHWCYANSVKMLFVDTWDQLRDDNAPAEDDAWNLLEAEANTPPKYVFVAGPKHPATYTPGQYMLGDYDADGKDDLLCHDVSSGRVWVDRLDDGLDGTDVSENHAFCNGDGLGGRERVYVGDFNGDGKDDLLCHNQVTGQRAFDFAYADGQLNGAQLFYNGDWCSNESQQLHVGDFDHDGKDDLLCHDFVTGYRYFDLGHNNLNGTTDKAYYNAWCNAPHQFLHTGRFRRGSRGDGLLCHDALSGMIWIDDPASPASIAADGNVLGSDHYDQTRKNFCKGGAQKLYVANVKSDSINELVCHDSDTGEYWIDEPDFSLPYYGSIDWSSGPTGWCTSQYQRLRFGDVDGNGRDDAVCFDQELGRRWFDLADESYFDGVTDDDAYTSWCHNHTQALH